MAPVCLRIFFLGHYTAMFRAAARRPSSGPVRVRGARDHTPLHVGAILASAGDASRIVSGRRRRQGGVDRRGGKERNALPAIAKHSRNLPVAVGRPAPSAGRRAETSFVPHGTKGTCATLAVAVYGPALIAFCTGPKGACAVLPFAHYITAVTLLVRATRRSEPDRCLPLRWLPSRRTAPGAPSAADPTSSYTLHARSRRVHGWRSPPRSRDIAHMIRLQHGVRARRSSYTETPKPLKREKSGRSPHFTAGGSWLRDLVLGINSYLGLFPCNGRPMGKTRAAHLAPAPPRRGGSAPSEAGGWSLGPAYGRLPVLYVCGIEDGAEVFVRERVAPPRPSQPTAARLERERRTRAFGVMHGEGGV